MEAAIHRSPHSHSDNEKFLLIDHADWTLSLNQIDGLAKNDVNYRQTTKASKLPHHAASAFSWSPIDEAIIAVGGTSGETSLLKINQDRRLLETVTTFKVKQQRKCYSIAFSSQNWLAVALDKVRSDVCLNIYDINADPSVTTEPVRKLCAAEHVSSVCFFPSAPQEVIATTQRSFVRIYDLREGYFGAGASGSLQANTRHVNNVTVDPLNENVFASAGSAGDPSFTVWDKRYMTHNPSSASINGAVLTCTQNTGSQTAHIRSLRWSGEKRGRLALATSNGNIHVYDVRQAATPAAQTSSYLPENLYGGTSWQSRHYVERTRSLALPQTDDRPEHSRPVAFDWVHAPHDDASVQPMLVLTADRVVRVLSVPKADTAVQVTAREDLALTSGGLTLTEATVASALATSSHEAAEDFGPHQELENSSQATAESRPRVLMVGSPELSYFLSSSTLQRRRCEQGYLFDFDKNTRVVAGNWHLQRLWEIIKRFHDHSVNSGMRFSCLDLSYVGISCIWTERIGNMFLRSSPKGPHDPPSVNEAILGINNNMRLPAFEGTRTAFPEHRQLCLLFCGWKFTPETLEAECQELVDRGLHYLSIVQAVLHSAKHLALNILRDLIRRKVLPNIGLGALIASDSINQEQKEMCLWMAADTEDTALKALLVFLSTGDWRDVMKPSYLHMGYRIALGLMYLNDSELSTFLQLETARAVRNGDLEGILLTGLGEQGMDLFQTYITKTGDLQTAVLAMSRACPKYVDDVRYEMWKETYLDEMLRWRAFGPRAKFVTQYTHFARRDDGSSMLEHRQPQVILRCNHCQAPLGHHRNVTSTSHTPSAITAGRQTETRPSALAGTICTSCGRHMSRCGICGLWLGTPDTTTKAGAREMTRMNGTMEKFLAFCARCGHGFHVHHAREWFGRYEICAVAECGCRCGLGGWMDLDDVEDSGAGVT